jgi:hypothetical protein
LTALQFEKGLASYEDIAVGNVPPETIVDGPHLRTFLQDFSPKTAPLAENILDVRYSRNKQIVRTLARYRTPPNRTWGKD